METYDDPCADAPHRFTARHPVIERQRHLRGQPPLLQGRTDAASALIRLYKASGTSWEVAEPGVATVDRPLL